MSILLYCVAEKSRAPAPSVGVACLPVSRSESNEIVALFSKGASADVLTGTPLRESAQQFHHVLQQVFSGGAIIPFRFPTLMKDEAELSARLQENSASYSSYLRKFKNSVQMEAVISYSDFSSGVTAKTSGTEYLRSRQKHLEELQGAASQLRDCAGDAAKDWRDRSIQNALRLFALVDRDRVPTFKDTLRDFKVPSRLTVRVTGPWPVTEFLDVDKL
jgi:hypothetical protein